MASGNKMFFQLNLNALAINANNTVVEDITLRPYLPYRDYRLFYCIMWFDVM